MCVHEVPYYHLNAKKVEQFMLKKEKKEKSSIQTGKAQANYK
jgi:hypothetical protein